MRPRDTSRSTETITRAAIPVLAGRRSHRRPVFSTNRMTFSAARCGTGQIASWQSDRALELTFGQILTQTLLNKAACF